MSDVNTKIIIDVNLTSEESNQKAKDLGVSIKAIREEQKLLKASGKETDVAFQSNAISLRQLQAEQKAYIAITNAADGSNNQLRAQLSLLTQQYNGLGKEERDSTVAGKALQVQIRGLSDEIKVNEEKVGDHRRSVGDYEKANRSATDSIKQQGQELSTLTSFVGQAPIGFQILGKQIGTVNNQLQNFRQANKEARVAQQEFSVAQKISTEATQASEAATAAATEIGFKFTQGQATAAEAELARAVATDTATVATAAQTAATEAQTVATAAGTNAAKVFKIALASTGIGAIIILVAALVTYLKDFDPLVDTIEQLFAGFKAGIDVVGRVITGFISNIKSMGDLFSKLGGIIAHPVDSFKSLGKEMNTAARAAMALKEAQQDLNDQLSAQEVINARAQQQIKELTLQSKNRSLSESERQKKAQQAQALELKNFNDRTGLANQELDLAVRSAGIKGKLNADEIKGLKDRGTAYAIDLLNRGKISDTEVDLIKKAELGKIQILDESTGRQEKLQNIADAAAERAKAEEEKRLTELTKSREKSADAEKIRLESLLTTNESILTARQKEIAAVNQDIDEKVEKYRKYGATTAQLEKERVARIKQITDESHKDDVAQIDANNKAIQDLLISYVTDQGDRELMQIATNNQRKVEAQDVLIAQTKERIQKGEEGLTELLLSQQTLRDELLTANQTELSVKQDEIKLAKEQSDIELHDREMERDQALADAKRQIQDEEFDNMKAGTDLLATIFDKNTAIGKAAFLAQKAVAIAQIIVQTQAALAANRLAEQLQNASLSLIPIAGIGLAAGNSIVKQAERTRILISGALSGAAVLAAAVAGFSTGGVFESDGKGSMVNGAGTGTSDSINARLSNGEAVINARSAKLFRPMLSAINMAGGGAALGPGMAMAAGGIAQAAQGGHISGMTDRVISGQEIANIVIAGVQAGPHPVVDVRQIVTETQNLQAAQVRANI
jgi:hypothetical protein